MSIFTGIKSDILPCLSLLVLFIGVLISGGLAAYEARHKSKKIPRLFYKIPFFLVLCINAVICHIIWSKYGVSFDAMKFCEGTGALSAEKSGLFIIRMEPFCAVTAALMSILVFIAGLRAMSDTRNSLTPIRAFYFITADFGINGILYFYSLCPILFFMALTQLGVTGLLCNFKMKKEEQSNIPYLISRGLVLVLLLSGVLTLRIHYGTDNIALLAQRVSPDFITLAAFILLMLPMLYVFVKPSPCPDASSSCMFTIRTQVTLFVICRVIFSIYGSMHGLEKVPLLFMLLASALLVLSYATPMRTAQSFFYAMQYFMKGTLLFAIAIAHTGVFTAENVVLYGISAMEATIWLWLIFLPVSSALAIITAYIDENGNDIKHTALIVFTLAVISFIQAGLPPFTGYSAKQLLLRSASFKSPFIFAVIAIFNILMLFNTLRFIARLILSHKKENSEDKQERSSKHTESSIAVPLVMLLLIFAYMSMLPGKIFDEAVSPAATSLINRMPFDINAPVPAEDDEDENDVTDGEDENNDEDDAVSGDMRDE